MATSALEYEHHGQHVVVDLTRSAPTQIRAVPAIEELSEHWEQKGYQQVIDVGCGRLRNSLVLVEHFALWICDFPEQLRNPNLADRLAKLAASPNFRGAVEADALENRGLEADAAVLAFVLHTLPEEALRVQLIRNVVRNTRPPHEIFIAVPNGEYYYRQRMAEQNRFNDGYLFGSGKRRTFYRDYSASQIDSFMAQLGFGVGTVFAADKKNQRTYLRR
jgi:hypothetical protein